MKVKISKYWQVLAISAFAVLTTGSAKASVTSVSATNDSSNAYYQINYTDAPSFFRVYLDTDKSSATGFPLSGIGANYMIENNTLYRYAGSGGSWAWSTVRALTMSRPSSTSVKWAVSRADLGNPAGLNLIANVSSPSYSSSVISQSFVSSTPQVSLAVAGAPNLPLNGTTTQVTVGFVVGTPTKVDISRDGYAAFGSWPSGTFFQLSADGKSLVGNWCVSSSCWQGVAGTHVLNVVATYSNGATAKASVTLNVYDSTTGTPASTTTTTTTTTSTTTTTMVSAPSPAPAPTPTPTGPVYYVSTSGNDSNSGSSSAPWRTIQKAANMVNPGDTVILMNGAYEEPEIIFKRSGTASAPIVFKAQNKWQAIVSSVSGCQPGVSLYGSYITLQDLRLSVSSKNANCTTYTSANVDIRAWNSVNATPSNPTTGLVGFHANGLKVDGLHRSEGVKSNQDFTIIENSEASNSIELFGSLNSVVRNNIVWAQDQYGVSIFAKGGVRNAQIYGNIVHNKASNGNAIIIGGYSCDSCHFDTSTNIEAYNSVAYNNVVINESSGQMAALMFQGAKDSAFFNNVVINGMLAMTLGGHNTGPQAPTSNPSFKNNIVMCNGASLTSGYFGWSSTGTMNMDYNDFYNCSGAPAQSHPVSGNPLFVNQLSDWHLQSGSPAINSGTPVSMPAYGGGSIDMSHDINGIVRTSPWDLGIYNY